jgi:hypothetical protein
MDRDHAAQHLGEGGLLGLAHLAHGERAGDVGGPVLVLRAAVDQEQLAGQDGGVRLLRHAVMDDGAMGTRARDGVEADVPERPGLGAEAFQRAHHVDLGQAAPGRGFVEPAQEPGEGRAVAQMRLGRGGDLGGMLARLAQEAGIGAGRHLRRARPERVDQRLRGRALVDTNRAGECG